jgi:hypothetical protein
MATGSLKVIEEEPPGKHELKTQFVEPKARCISYPKIAKMLKVADGN